MWDFPAAGEQMVPGYAMWDVGTMLLPMALRERRTLRNKCIHIKCSPRMQNPGFTETTGKLSLNSACSERPSGSPEIPSALRKTL